MPVMAVIHKATTVNLSILNFIFYSLNFFIVFYYFSDWVTLVYPSLALFVNAISFSLFSE